MNLPAPVYDTAPLVPTSMTEAMRLAEIMASAKLVPSGLQKSPGDCLMVIQQALRWQMDPFAVAQECSVIQGKLMHSGKLVAAVVNSRGNLTDRLAFSYEGAGDQRTITVTGRLQGELSPRTVSVKLGDAKTNNRVWQTQPDQQLMYHGVRVWARRHTPELMLGVYSPEEFEPDEPPATKRTPKPPAPNVMIDNETGEIKETTAPDTAASPGAADAAPLPDAPNPVVGSGAALSIEDMAREAASRGQEAMRIFWRNRTKDEQAQINKIRPELNKLVDAAETNSKAAEMNDGQG
jgi:hypothetical protein